ncbi:MAG TPA: hypothetical protein VGK67_06495 [Myxococcales bacterium]|jgi:hypothetical protein
MRGLGVLAATLATTALALACDPITRDDLVCGSGACRDAGSSSPDASAPGADAAQPGLDATPVVDAATPPDASAAEDASCARLYSLGYPSGTRLDSPCLRDIPRFQAGPCSGVADCHLDSRAFYESPDGGLIESVTASGKLWEFDGRSGAVLKDGVDLSSLSHLSAAGTGACAGKPALGCALDTRTYRPESGGGWTEAITNNGQMFNYDAFSHAPLSTPAVNGSPLTGQPRYSLTASAPCYGKSISECRFQTQAYSRAGGTTWEWITFDGNVFVLDGATGTAQAGNNTKLSQVPRFQTTVCAGVADCRLRTHAFVAAPDGGIVESFSD